MSDTLTKEQIDQILEDVQYLQDEAEALKYVIEEIPYDETPPGGRSVYEMLRLIDHAQNTYFRPVIEDACHNKHRTRLHDFDHYSDTFVNTEGEEANIQKILNKLVKHRNGIVNLLDRISVTDWNAYIYDGNNDIFVHEFVGEMIRFEREMLKEIADLVMVFGQERAQQREIEKRQEQRSGSSSKNPISED